MGLAIATGRARARAALLGSIVAAVFVLGACAGTAAPTSVTPQPSGSTHLASAPDPSAPAPPEGGPLPSADLPSGTPPDLPPTPDTLPPGNEAAPGEPAELEAFLEASRAWGEARGVTLDDDTLAAAGAARCAAVRSAGSDSSTIALEDALTAMDLAEPGYAREDLEELLAIALTHWCPSVTVEPQPSGGVP